MLEESDLRVNRNDLNKPDAVRALKLNIVKALALTKIKNRTWSIPRFVCIKGTGLFGGFDWLVARLKGRRGSNSLRSFEEIRIYNFDHSSPPSVSIFELGRIVVLSLRHCFLQVGIHSIDADRVGVCVGVCVRSHRGKKIKNTCLITLISISGFVK